jgi:hypothetical protein
MPVPQKMNFLSTGSQAEPRNQLNTHYRLSTNVPSLLFLRVLRVFAVRLKKYLSTSI